MMLFIQPNWLYPITVTENSQLRIMASETVKCINNAVALSMDSHLDTVSSQVASGAVIAEMVSS